MTRTCNMTSVHIFTVKINWTDNSLRRTIVIVFFVLIAHCMQAHSCCDIIWGYRGGSPTAVQA